MLVPQLTQLVVEQYQDQYQGDLGSYHDGHCQEGPLLDSFIGCTNWGEEEEEVQVWRMNLNVRLLQ